MIENDVGCSNPDSSFPIVILDFNDLSSTGSSLGPQISAAFGRDGLGLLCVRGVPGYEQARCRLLPLARKFAELDSVVKVCRKFMLFYG